MGMKANSNEISIINRNVMRKLMVVRQQGIARRLGVLEPHVIEIFKRGADILKSDDSYVEETAAHWERAGLKLSAQAKNGAYIDSLRNNVTLGKITDEAGGILEAYRETAFETALPLWLSHVNRYAANPSLTRINVSQGGCQIAEHLDPPDQNMIQCLLEGGTTFEFRGADGSYEYQLKVGEIWWFNTTWPHRTFITGEGRRLLLHTRAEIHADYLACPESPPDRFTPRRHVPGASG